MLFRFVCVNELQYFLLQATSWDQFNSNHFNHKKNGNEKRTYKDINVYSPKPHSDKTDRSISGESKMVVGVGFGQSQHIHKLLQFAPSLDVNM